MINELKTFLYFGYNSSNLKIRSSKIVWRICTGCGKEQKVAYAEYTRGRKRCKSCSAKYNKHMKSCLEYILVDIQECDKVYNKLVEPLTVKPIPDIKGTTQLFENEE